MKRYVLMPLALSVIGFSSPVIGEEMDVSKITCADVAEMKTEQVLSIGIWMSGYVHGKKGSTVLDFDKMEANADRVDANCAEDPSQPLITAVEKAAGMMK